MHLRQLHVRQFASGQSGKLSLRIAAFLIQTKTEMSLPGSEFFELLPFPARIQSVCPWLQLSDPFAGGDRTS